MIEALLNQLNKSIVALQLMKLTIDEDEDYPIDEPKREEVKGDQ
jgi:hypothetical protein